MSKDPTMEVDEDDEARQIPHQDEVNTILLIVVTDKNYSYCITASNLLKQIKCEFFQVKS